MRTPCLALVVLAFASAIAMAKPPRWQTLPLPPAMPRATTSGYVEVDGVDIYYATYGKPEGPIVILLHGGLGNADHWAFQVPALVERYRVIAIDSRHQGRSGFSKKTKLTYHRMADDVVAVMDHLRIKSASLVGWSDGGNIALDLAIHHPERVRKLFVYGANYDASGSKPRTKSTATFNGYAAKCRRDFVRIAKNPKSYEAVVASLRPIWTSSPALTKDQLRGIEAPTVVALGEHDEIIRLEHAKEMAELIPNAKPVIFEDTSHFSLWQDPAAFNAAVLELLR